MFSRVGVLNRGEAAVRFMRAARTWSRINDETLDVVAFYTTPDRRASFVRMASASVCLGEALTDAPGGGRRSAYLDVERVIALALDAGVDAIWPGWGFLAESPELVDACTAAGITFIGPSAEAMRLLGDKVGAKLLAEKHNVPVSAWSGGLVADPKEAAQHAERIGYPVLLKATAGGGGRGIRIVHKPDELAAAFESATAEAGAAFGNAGLLVESFVPVARHVEVQVLADTHGQVWALGTRDCSMQRRHQKVLEEAPAPNLDAAVERRLCQAAIGVSKASGYVGAGTAEFLLKPDGTEFYFLEMNTRLQVEHTVTECIYGVDLVMGQIDIAMGKPLPSAEPPEPRGVAIEARLNAEDPDKGFTPSAGEIVRFDAPQGPGIRVDSGVSAGDKIPSEFDSNIAKIIGFGDSRSEALARLGNALNDCVVAIEGGPSNRSLLMELVGNSEFQKGAVTTRWLDERLSAKQSVWSRPYMDVALAAAALGDHLRARRGHILNFMNEAHKGLPRRVPEPGATSLRYLIGESAIAVSVATMGPFRFRAECGDGALEFRAESTGPRTFTLETADSRHSVIRIGTPTAVFVDVDGVSHRFDRTSDGRVLASIPAAVTRVHVSPGQRVNVGDRLITLEVMKMETAVDSPLSGIVGDVLVDSASRVAAGDVLLTIEGEEGDGQSAGDATPQVFSVSEGDLESDEDVIGTFQLGLLGYDVTDSQIDHAIERLKSGDVRTTRRRLYGLLRAWTTQESLYQAGPYDDAPTDAGESSGDQLLHFIRHGRLEPDEFSAPFQERMKAFLAMHGVQTIREDFAQQSALLRLFQSHQTPKRSDRMLFPILSALVQTEDDSDGVQEESDRRETLESLANYAVHRNRRLAQASWQAIYLMCDLPRHRLNARRLSAQCQDALARLVDPESAEVKRTEARKELLELPLGSLLELAAQVADDPAHRRTSLLSVIMERIYDRPLDDGVSPLPDLVNVGLRGAKGAVVHGVFVATPDELLSTLQQLPADSNADLVLGYSPQAEVTPDLFAGVSCVRVSFIWGGSMDGLRSRTYVKNDTAEWTEIEVHRDLHPARATALEVNRLSAFELTRLPAPGGLFLAHAAARDGSGDERMFAVGEVERIEAEKDPHTGGVRLPNFEKVYLDAIHAMREGMRLRGGREKLVWNRLTIFIRPVVKLTRKEIESVASRLAPPTIGLGLEKLVVRAKIDQPEHPDRPAVDTIVEWSNPTGRGPVLSFALPRQRPVRVLSDYERRVVAARRRGLLYPYELIRSLASDETSGGFAAGEFEELDLNAEGTALESVYKRPYGQNEANLVVGRVTNRTERFPEGLTRMLIVGDPTRKMGSVAEPECRRIIAALDLCEQMDIPLEWVPISSGAKIAFDSGTENLDWTARVLKRIIEFTQNGGIINIIVDGICVGAQSYWNAEATMLMHCKGTLIMTEQGCMLLTGRKALEYSGSVSAATNQAIGGLEAVMGPNGQAQYVAPNLRKAYDLLFRHYELTYCTPDAAYSRRGETSDPNDRDITQSQYLGSEGFATVGEVFSDETNPGRKRPFAIREAIRAILDQDIEPIERWPMWEGAETAAVFHGQMGGQPICAIGIESMPVKRRGETPADGPDTWTSGTLFPQSSRKVARAINASSGIAPIVVFANLSGFDGSPESLRKWQLEYGAEIGRAVVNFKGPIVFCVISRYHGGAYVVFSQSLNDNLEALALNGTYASVIGGGPAAAVVFPGVVRRRTRENERVVTELDKLKKASPLKRAASQARYEAVYREVEAEVQREVADEFDSIHTVERAMEVGSLSSVLPAEKLRPILCKKLADGIKKHLA